MRPLGYTAHGEHIFIEDWNVQFLPALDALHEEALSGAVETELNGVPIRVMTAEHLMAIALQTGRRKDFQRIEQFVSENVFDAEVFAQIIKRHGLGKRWDDFNRGLERVS